MSSIPSSKGLYLLLLKLERKVNVKIGKLGCFKLPSGFYVYVGSAKGPGGLRARILRHLKLRKKKKWHIDYLTTLEECKILATFIIPITNLDEASLVRLLEEMGGKHLVNRFGSTDDMYVRSHLLYFDLDEKIYLKIKNTLKKKGISFSALSFTRPTF